MEFPKAEEPRSLTPDEINAQRLAAAASAAGTAEAYRQGAVGEKRGHVQEAMARYAAGYQQVADEMLRLAAIEPADNLVDTDLNTTP